MSIEIKQLSITSSVVLQNSESGETRESREETAALRHDILRECKRIIQEILSEKSER